MLSQQDNSPASGQVVGIVGEPGMGKSRLLYEFTQSLCGQASVIWPVDILLPSGRVTNRP
jgi:putative protein kinase ArgK-like GTPase of G3E family